MTTFRYEDSGADGFIDDIRIGQVAGSRTATIQFFATRPTFAEVQTVDSGKVVVDERPPEITREILFSATMDLQTLAIIHERISRALEPLRKPVPKPKKKTPLRVVKAGEGK